MKTRFKEHVTVAFLAMLTALVAIGLCGCSGQTAGTSNRSAAESFAGEAADTPASEQASKPEPSSPAKYPTAWLAVDYDAVPSGTPVRVLALPQFEVAAHRDGDPVDGAEQEELDAALPEVDSSQAVIEYDGETHVVPVDYLLVNLPDFLPEAEFDVVYSYASTSRCAGEDIPGVTGQKLPGYCDGKQESAYWNGQRFVMPCAYRTAVKARAASEELAARGWRLLVFDAYRPMTAQLYLSDQFEQAYYANPTMQASMGGWGLLWYVANGASGHNYGTDLDVGVCDMSGNAMPMPSDFDTFDESGHLAAYPLDASAITPDAYREEVSGNDACLALHEAFTSAGFSELASEWWHFGDGETEYALRLLVGDGGLDFEARLD